MRRLGRYRRKRQNRIILITAFSLLFIITAGYAAFSTNITFHAKGNIIEGPRVIQAWDENSQTDFHSDYYKQNIVSATFVDNNNVPDSAAESWNVSEDKENGEVMAWVVPSVSDSSKYDLYIGAKAGVIANENSGYVFYNFRSLKEINFENNFDTSNATDMSFMFDCCTSLEELDLSSFDTSNVTSMESMFNMWDESSYIIETNYLKQIIFGDNFITNNVTNMRSMFAGLTELTNLDLSRFNTSNVTDMYHMFTGCKKLTALNLSNFDTSNVTNMRSMFSMDNGISSETSTGNLTVLDLSSFNTSKVTDMAFMFQYNKNLLEIKGLENFDTSNVTNMNSMFSRLEKIKTLNLCSFNTSKVTNMAYMFDYTYNLEHVYVGSGWSKDEVTIDTYMWSSSNISQVTTGMC